MTGLMSFFAFLCVTEIYDTFLRDNLLKENTVEDERRRRAYHEQYGEEEMDCNAKPCIYELLCCGVLRNCLLRDELPGERNENRKRKKCGVLTFTALTFFFGLIMELCHYSFFCNMFESF